MATESPKAKSSGRNDYIADDGLHTSLDNLQPDQNKDLNKIGSRERFGHKASLSQAKPVPFSRMKIEEAHPPVPFSNMQIEHAQFEVTNDSRLPLKINDAKLLHMLEWKKEKERMMI